MTDAIEALRGQLVLLHSLANDTTEANWRDKRLYILQTCVRMLDALAALDAETPSTPADVEAETIERCAKVADKVAAFDLANDDKHGGFVIDKITAAFIASSLRSLASQEGSDA